MDARANVNAATPDHVSVLGLAVERGETAIVEKLLSAGARTDGRMPDGEKQDLLIADEPTTALDVTIQAQILELLAELQQRLGMAIVFITHDLGIVRRFADRIYVMRPGEVVEEGETEAIFTKPQHAYTKMLLAAEPTGRKAPPPARRADAARR